MHLGVSPSSATQLLARLGSHALSLGQGRGMYWLTQGQGMGLPPNVHGCMFMCICVYTYVCIDLSGHLPPNMYTE